MQTDLFRVHDLLHSHFNIVDIAIGVEAFHHGGAVPAGHKEVDVASGFPLILSHNLFGFVVDVVDGGGEGLALFVSEGVEH